MSAFTFLVFLIFCFPLFYNPVSMVGMLMLVSISVVGSLSLVSSFWYSYILFLIYVGGLLVLFIYICLVSSNIHLGVSMEGLMGVSILSLVYSMSGVSMKYPLGFLGQGGWSSGMSLMEESNVSIFIFLVVLLLGMLLVVVRTSGVGSAIVIDDKKS